jgi:hypothetical protein
MAESRVSWGLGLFCESLAIAFIVLKLAKAIDWPWIWVLAPVWIPLAVVLAAVVMAIVMAAASGGKWR